MTPEEDWALEDRIAKALREEGLRIFGSTWNLENAHRLARAAIEEAKQFLREKL